MSIFKVVLPMAAILVCTLFLPGCSKGAISITLTPTTTVTINQGATQAITATVANDITNDGVTWSLGTTVGTLIDQTKTSVTYVAPTVVSTITTATVTATSVANASITASLSVTINPVLAIATPSLPVGIQNTPYFGVVSATGGSGTFTWTVTSGALPAGLTLSSSTTSTVTISGTPTATGTSSFTVQVTVGGSTVSQALSITINPPPPLSVGTKFLPAGTVGAAYSAALDASSGTAPYTWSITPATLPNLPNGLSLTGTGNNTISGTPTTVSAVPTPTFVVQVVDSSSPAQTATATLSIAVNPSTAFNSQLNGTYAFLVSGFVSSAQYAIAGSMVADGKGDVTGVIDDPVDSLSDQAFTGSYLIASNGLGTMTLTILGFPRTLTVALTPPATGSTISTSGRIIECEGSTCGTSGSGILVQQQTSAFSTIEVSGAYAFGFSGADSGGGRSALAGSFTATNGAFTNGLLDSNDAGTASASVAFTGTYSIPATAPPALPTGRGTATITISGSGTTSYVIYVVSAQEVLALETDRISVLSGTILQQTVPPGGFGSSSLNGVAAFETTASNSGTALGQVGLLTAGGTGTMSTAFDQSTGTGVQVTDSGTYAPAPGNSGSVNGRFTLSGSGIASPDPVLYLVSSNEAFIVGADTAVTFGFMKPQLPAPTPPFSVSSLSGAYAGGSLAPILSTASDQLDIASANGAGALTFTTDIASSSGLAQNQASSVTYTLDSNGRGTETPTTAGATTTGVFYVVTPPGISGVNPEFWSVTLGPNGMIEIFQQ